MKPLLLASFALAALPLIAGETQAPPPATTTDSPLVAAAKSSAAKKRKATIVITNDNLVKSGGHITTTASQAPLPPIALGPTEAQLRLEEQRKAIEAKDRAAKAAAAEKAKDDRTVARLTLEAQEGGAQTLFDDPATAEAVAEQAAKQQKEQKEKEQKKPPM